MKQLLSATTIVFIVLFTGCYNDKADQLYPQTAPCDTTNVTFATDILPIMTKSCATPTCHDAVAAQNGYNLTGYSGAKMAVDEGKMIGVIRHDPGFQFMPKDLPKLSDCEINKVIRWVNLGAKP